MSKKSIGRSGYHFWAHLAFWSLYLLSEYLANRMHLEDDQTWSFLGYTLLGMPVLWVPTYFLLWVVVPKWLKRGKMPLFALALITCGVYVIFLRVEWKEWVMYLEEGRMYNVPLSKLLKNIIRDYSIIALAVCLAILGDWREKYRQNEMLIKARAEAEMQLLKRQLHPHFLFNSLNNIYSQALAGSKETADSILRLTELLDYLLYRVKEERISLATEIEMVKSYLDLEKLRYGEKDLRLHAQFEVSDPTIEITPVLLLPFIENCFKHGGKDHSGVFRVNLLLRADDRSLFFELENSKPDRTESVSQAHGVGLPNIKKRLELIYPEHELVIQDDKQKYRVQLTLTKL